MGCAGSTSVVKVAPECTVGVPVVPVHHSLKLPVVTRTANPNWVDRDGLRQLLSPEAEDILSPRGREFQEYVHSLVVEYQSRAQAADAFHMVEQSLVGNAVEGCIFVGHINTDLDSIAGALGAAALFGGLPAKAEETLNGEIAFALGFAGLQAPQHFDVLPGGGHPDGGEFRRVCLVDHNEAKQMTPKLRHCQHRKDRIVGLIDHHAVSEAFCTERSLFMDVRPWGSMSSIVAHTFIRESIPMSKQIARILLCAILSDTLNLRSVTTTKADRLMVGVLAALGEVGSFPEVNELAKLQFRAKTEWIVNLGTRQMIRGDQKDFTANGSKLSITVLEVTSPEAVRPKLKALAEELRALKEEKGLDYAFCFIVDVAEQRSDLVLCGAGELALAHAAFPKGRLWGPVGPGGQKQAEGLEVQDVDEEVPPLSGAGLAAPGVEDPAEATLLLEGALMDVGGLVSRKSQFAPAVLKALNGGFQYPAA